MKFEKRKVYKLPRLQWGLLPSIPVTEEFLQITPSFLSNNYQHSHRILNKFLQPNNNLNVSLTSKTILEGFEDESAYVFEKYIIFRQSSFINFFEARRIDVPKCFKKSQSLKRPTFELFFLRLVNYLTKSGKKEKIFVALNKAFNVFYLNYKTSSQYTLNLQFSSWIFLYFAFNNITSCKQKYFNFFFNQYGNTFNQHFIKSGFKYHINTSDLLSIASKLLSIVQPLFYFSLFSLDKRARKSGRKKSSKYIFIWRYVPLYKRKALLLKLIANDIKFNAGKTLIDRLLVSLETLSKNPENSHVVQTNRFAHQYVFKNLRRSLLINFRMTA